MGLGYDMLGPHKSKNIDNSSKGLQEIRIYIFLIAKASELILLYKI